MLFNYNKNDENSIMEYAKRLENRTFQEILDEYEEFIKKETNIGVAEDFPMYTTNKKAKGQLGNFLEKYYFGYNPNGVQAADFEEVGIELKQTCIDKLKNGKFSAGERLSITNISYENPVEANFYESHVWEKIKRILLVHYLRDKTKDRMEYQILFVNLFTPPENDLSIIINDYNTINLKIKAGLAHELSESDTLYLGACTKGATATKSLKPQYYGSNELAKKRNFCFKRSYMDYVLNSYILKGNVPYELIVKDSHDLTKQSLEEIVINKINQFIGKTDRQLCEIFNIEYKDSKALWTMLAYRMLGIKGNHAQEFVKAGVVVKTIRIEENGKIKENMSFPPFRFKTLVSEEWEDSEVFRYFNETKFLFIVYQSNGDHYELKESKIWNMPYNDLNEIVREGWLLIQDSIQKGVRFIRKGNTIRNSLPKKSDNKIIHIRPHAKKAAYLLADGYQQGDILSDANELPNGEWMTTQSFWINNHYILKQLKYKK